MSRATVSSPIPVTILTGFLGAGKTTLLNRLLSERRDERIAVIENEFGEVGIDNALLVSDSEQIVEMNNGCVCCTVRGDLVRILGELADKRAAGELDFARVLIETTGLANPGPVAQTFFLDPGTARRFRLDAVLTVVDAVHGMRQLDEHEVAQEQVGFADRVLLSKTDLIDHARVGELKRRLGRINPRASVDCVQDGHPPVASLLDVGGFNLDAVLDVHPNFLAGRHAHHADRIASSVFRADREFDADRLQDFLAAIVRVYGADLLRYKGVLSVKGFASRVIMQGVHENMASSRGAPWEDGRAKASTFVFIGRDLPADIIAQGLTQCLC